MADTAHNASYVNAASICLRGRVLPGATLLRATFVQTTVDFFRNFHGNYFVRDDTRCIVRVVCIDVCFKIKFSVDLFCDFPL